MSLSEHIAEEAQRVNRHPSDPQKAYGNYRKGHVKLHGLDVSIENPRGSLREGKDAEGKSWRARLPAHYGYLRRTEGADGDHVDVFVGRHHRSPLVYVVDQKNHANGRFDEHKAFIGFATPKQVKNTYFAAFSDGKGAERLGAIHEMTVAQFKDWLHEGDTTKPFARRADGGAVNGMIEPGNIDLHNRPVVHNDDGSISTVRSIGANVNGREVLMPTVYGNSILPDNDAIRLYQMSGKHLGMFDTPENSEAYAQSLHEDQAQEYQGRAPGGRIHMADGGTPVTDPDVLAQLNAPTPVTDPALLAQLNAPADSQPSAESGLSSYLPKAITDIPHEAYETTANQVRNVGQAWDNIRQRHAEQAQKDAGPSGSFFDPSAFIGQAKDVIDTGRALVSGAAIPVAPVQGAAESLIGHPMAQAEHAVGTIINPKVAAQDNPEEMYRTAKGDVDLALSSAAARKAPAFSTAPVKNIPAPSTKELFRAADNNYQNMRGYGVEIHPQAVSNVADNILTELHTEGYRDYLAPKTFRAVEELKNPVGKNVEISDIEGVRRALNKAAKDPAERDAVRRAIGGIDDYLANLHPNDVVVNPHYAQQVGQEAVEARSNYAAAKRSEQLDEIGKKASRQANAAKSGTNIDNATRQKIKSVLDNPKKLRGFSDAEKEQMEKIVRGTSVGNVARLLGKFSPSGVVSGALSAGAGFAAHGPLGAVALPAAGYVAKKIGDASTAAQAIKLSRLVRARSPVGRQMTINHVAQHALAPSTQYPALAAPIAGVAGMRMPAINFRPSGGDQS